MIVPGIAILKSQWLNPSLITEPEVIDTPFHFKTVHQLLKETKKGGTYTPSPWIELTQTPTASFGPLTSNIGALGAIGLGLQVGTHGTSALGRLLVSDEERRMHEISMTM